MFLAILMVLMLLFAYCTLLQETNDEADHTDIQTLCRTQCQLVTFTASASADT